MTKVPVNQVILFSIVGGPGNRTSTLLQKCNITCGYCHNPEAQNLCNNCGVCVPRCPEGALSVVDRVVMWDEFKCVSYNTYIKVCPHRASPKVRWMGAPAAMKEVERDIPLICGITISGGECGLYLQFLQELFTLARVKGFTYLLDSNSTVCFSRYPELMRIRDGVMLDVKVWSPGVLRVLTGSDNAAAKENLLFLSSCGKLERVHVVNVEGHIDAGDTVRGTAELFDPLTGNTCLLLVSFRSNDVKDPFVVFSPPSAERMKQLVELTASAGLRNIIAKQRQAAALRQL